MLPGRPRADAWSEGLLSADLDRHLSISRPVEFAEEDSLPRPQFGRAAAYQDLLAAAYQRTLAVRVGVALAVSVAGATLRHQLFKSQEHIVSNGRVGVFIYGDSRGRVRTIDYCVAVSYARLADERSHLARDINHLVAALGADVKVFLDDFHYCHSLHLLDYFDAQ